MALRDCLPLQKASEDVLTLAQLKRLIRVQRCQRPTRITGPVVDHGDAGRLDALLGILTRRVVLSLRGLASVLLLAYGWQCSRTKANTDQGNGYGATEHGTSCGTE
jgi:hypothetical protein